MSIDKYLDVLSSTDRINTQEVSEADTAAFASSWLVEKGYPVIHTDFHDLQQDFLNKNYPARQENA